MRPAPRRAIRPPMSPALPSLPIEAVLGDLGFQCDELVEAAMDVADRIDGGGPVVDGEAGMGHCCCLADCTRLAEPPVALRCGNSRRMAAEIILCDHLAATAKTRFL